MKYSTRYIPVKNVYGAVVTYNCLPRYWIKQDVRNVSIVCTKFGTWSNASGVCKREFRNPRLPFYHRSFEGPSDVTWLSFGVFLKWKICIHYSVIRCPVVPVWDDLEANTTENVVGTTLNISCSTGDNEMKTSFVISRCTSNGTWVPSFNRCKGKII